MSLALVNGCIFFPHLPNYAAALPVLSRTWQTVVKTAANGQEERDAMKSVPLRKIKYTVTTETQPESALFEARLTAALQSGAAACPLSGRGARLTSAAGAGDTTLDVDSQWTWTVGDWVFLCRFDLPAKQWVLRQITGVTAAGGTTSALALSSAAGFALPVSGPICVFPLLYGGISAEPIDRISDYHLQCQITVAEPVGTAVFGGSTPTALADPPAPSDPYNVCETSGLLTIAAAACGASRVLNWTEVTEADSYNLYVANNAAGPWVLQANYGRTTFSATVNVPFYSAPGGTNQSYYTIALAYGAPAYWEIRAVIGGIEAVSSGSVQMPALTLERIMRAYQERAVLTNTLNGDPAPPPYPLIWPAGVTVGAPAAYPTDGWYAADFTGVANTVTDIQAVVAEILAASVFWDSYTPVSTLQGVNPSAVPGPDFTPINTPLVVTNVNYITAVYDLLYVVCQLNALTVDASVDAATEQGRGAQASAPWPADTNPALLAACMACAAAHVASVPWGDEYFYDGACNFLTSGGASGSPISGEFIGAYEPSTNEYFGVSVGVRGKVKADLSAITSGTAELFTSIVGPMGAPATGNPRGFLDTVYNDDQGATVGGMWTSNYIAGSDLPNITGGQWTLNSGVQPCVVLCKPVWTYLPYPT